ncbi:MAG TPA: FAD-dependent oxidoreductase [Candidatus Saccharimonadales bacterium]|nr:FAD-dependent oxidoreductase [Candidatus Saccharimonadales bacterium]
MQKTEKVLIVGGGFAGVKAALELKNSPHFDVTLLSDTDELRYYPTLYHTATGSSSSNSSISLKSIFAGSDIKIAKGEAVSLDRKARIITTTDNRTFSYDALIIALGVVTNYFGIPGLADYSYSIKTQEEVARLKKHLHKQLEDDRQPDLNYVIVGAGPTGIELAGALPHYMKHILKNHGIPEKKIHVDIIEAMPRLLPNLPKSVSKQVGKQLRKLGIKLYLNSKVEGESADELTVNGKPIRSHTVIWTAGVTNHPFFKDNNFALMARGKVAVDVFLQTEPNVFVLGDNANTPYSGLAQTALHDAVFVANNLKRRAEGKDFKGYKLKKPITVIPAGPGWAAVVWRKLHFSGSFGFFFREAADFKGFMDLENPQKATEQFASEFITEDDCEVCMLAMSRYSA